MQALNAVTTKLVRNSNVASFFLVCASIFGVVTVFLSPPMQPADESLHYWRAYQLSNFDLLAEKFSNNRFGYKIPSEIKEITDTLGEGSTPKARTNLKKINEMMFWRNYVNKEIAYFENSAINSPVGYTPYSLIFLLGRTIEVPHLMLFYIARLTGLIFYIGICFAAIKLAPRGKLLITSIGLLPMSVYLASSISIDAMLISVTLLAVALTMRLTEGYSKANKKLFLLLVFTIILLSILKTGYFILSILLFKIPKQYFGEKAKAYLFLAFLITLLAGLGLLWNILVYDVANTIHSVLRPGEKINIQDQISFIKSHPLHTIGAFLNTYLLKSSTLLVMSFVGIFGWLDIVMPFFVYIIFGMLLYYHIQNSSLYELHAGDLFRNKVYITTAALLIGYITLSLYIGYSVVGSNYVEGLQGRYFIPIVALLVPIFAENDTRRNKKVSRLYMFLTVFLLASMIFSLINANVFRINY